MIKEEEIRLAAQKVGIPIIGFTDDSPLVEIEDYLVKRNKEGGTPFVRMSPQKRVDYHQAFETVKTVIVIGVPYT